MSAAAYVAVDPRVELMCIIFRLAGNPEYRESSLPRYDQEVEAHFAPFEDHPAVGSAAKLREARHVRWAAPISLAVHLVDAHSLAPRVALDPRPSKLDGRWRPEETLRFLDAARDFVSETAFADFTSAHQSLYQGAVGRIQEALAQWGHLDWFDDFYGDVASGQFHVIVGMLTGQNSYGASYQAADVSEIYAVQAVYGASDDGLPVVDHDTVGCIVHEFSHAYVTPMIHAHADEFRDAGEQLFPAGEMADKGYGSSREMTYETLVRACEMRYYTRYLGDDATSQKIAWNTRTGFRLVGPLSELLGEYESNRERYPTLATFLPEIARFFEEQARSLGPAAR